MLPEHVKKSITEWFEKDEEATFFERIELQEEAVEKYRNESYPVRYGRILEHILNRMSVVINTEENIIGGVKEIIPDDEQREWAEGLSSGWWEGVSEEEKQHRIMFYYSPGWIKRRNPLFFTFGHLAFDWEAIITRGLAWHKDRAQELLDSGKFYGQNDRIEFLKGAVIGYQAHTDFINRYADEAERLGRKDLAELCREIAGGPAENFHQALQLIWFVTLISQKVAGCGVFCFDRMDQYLMPFYERDIAEGRLTEDDAYGLIVEFFNKNNDIMDPADHMSQEASNTKNNLEVTYDDPNYIIIAGLLEKGLSGVNRLSHLMIRASHEMGLRNPFIVVRWHEGIDSDFWTEVCDAMRHNSTVVVYNDETMIPALLEFGVEAEDVYGYGYYGCNDPLIPAKEGGLRQLWVNLVWPFELALNGGRAFCAGTDGCVHDPAANFDLRDRLIGLMSGVYSGQTEGYKDPDCMEAFVAEYRKQLQFLLLQYLEKMEEDYKLEKQYSSDRIRIEDLFLQGTIDSACNWIAGGTKYHKITMQGSGLATAIDSLAALDIAVFKEKKYTLEQLREALRTDFADQEEMRIYLDSLPKFGNDAAEVDEYAAVVTNAFCDVVAEMNERRTGLYSYMPTISTDRDFTGMGSCLAATADGRRAGQAIAENQSPYMGADQNGVTALLNSVSKVPFNRITGGPLNVMLHPSTIEGDDGLAKLAALFSVFMKKGGMQIQLNVVGRDELLEAQKNPDQHKNLCVRVTGYSAYFVQMGKIAQDELINRTVN